MTYVSRRARITVPRWPNDFDPEFLFRVGRRCDGRLKRHSSCHDLRAWINDNCIKNEYLLDLMSDGEVTITPPLQLYGRFIPVPLLFKLLQNSGSENASEVTEWEKIFPKEAPEVRDNKTKSEAPYRKEKIKRKSIVFDGETEDKSKGSGFSFEETDKSKGSGFSFEENDKSKGSGFSSEEKDKSKESGSSIEESAKSKVSEGPIRRESSILKGRKSTHELHLGFQKQAGEESPSTYNAKRKWDPFEKMEYYTSGFASKGALVEGVHPRPSSTQSMLVPDDDRENRKSKSESHRTGSEGSLGRVILEKSIIERNLFKSTCLLGRAMGKLEKIDKIVTVTNEDMKKIRKEEIQEAFQKPKVDCIFLQDKSASERTPGSNVTYRVRNPRDLERQETLKCNELLRQISGLREKLKKNQECQQRLNQEITMFQREAESMNSSHMSELDNREGQAQQRKLQKRLERLINNRGKLLSEMCQALTSLNSLKRCKNSRGDLRQRTRSGENRYVINCRHDNCTCGKYQSSDSEKAHCSDSGSSSDNHFRRKSGNVNYHDDKKYYDYSSTDSPDSGQQNLNDERRTKTTDTLNEVNSPNGELYKDNEQEKERKSILRFCCPDPPCGQEFDNDLDGSENNFRPRQYSYNQGASVSNPLTRPSTSPTTNREKWDASEERWRYSYEATSQEIPERRVKSETTMKEIEKTLRNYEQRLSDMDGLEYKVEEWKKKLLEACRMKRNASRLEAQMQKEQEDERNKATIHINGLFMENCELKKQIQQLTEKSKEQAKKIQNMKSSILKAREMENEAEQLKKELSEYRNSYEHQRKCISKWESVVALQRKEIENLMNHIRKLTTEKREQITVCCQDKVSAARKFVQRTRSCSPVNFVDCQTYCRPQQCNQASEEENGSCCCQDFRQSDSRRNHLRCFDNNYYSSVNDSEDWCN